MNSSSTLVFVLLALSITCNGDDGDPDAQMVDFDRTAMIENLVTNVIVPLYQQFEDDAAALETAVADYCGALGGAGEDTARDAAREAWRTAMQTWQQAELTQVGPTGAEGAALRDEIYSWPLVSTCAVDNEIVSLRNDPTSYDISSQLPNRRGLDALEYVLFTPTLDHSCTAATAPDGWDALADADKRAARCDYAAAVAGDLVVRATDVVEAWTGAGGFADRLVAAGDGNPYETAHDGVDALFAGIFYLELTVKDLKLSRPVGITDNRCGAAGTLCPEDLESQHAQANALALAANLASFRMLFTGGDGPSFDEMLRAYSADTIADETNAAIDDAEAGVEALTQPFADILASDPSELEAIHADVKRATDHLKNDMPETLGLTIPGEAGGDTD